MISKIYSIKNWKIYCILNNDFKDLSEIEFGQNGTNKNKHTQSKQTFIYSKVQAKKTILGLGDC